MIAVARGWWWRVRLRWVVVTSSIGAAAFAVLLALTDGADGVLRGAAHETEFLVNLPVTPPAAEFLRTFVDRIGDYSVHVRGHPPGFVLALKALDAVHLGGDWATAALSIVATAAAPAGVLVAVWAVAGAPWVRRTAPVLIVTPYALWMVTSADAVYTAVGAWAVALLAVGLRPRGPIRIVTAAAAGLLLGDRRPPLAVQQGRAASDDLVCFMDCDASLDPLALPLLTEYVERDEADLVLGQRIASRGAWAPHARVANRVLSAEVRRRTGLALPDLGPMRVARRLPLLDLGLRDRRFGWPLEMVLRASAAGWRLRVVPVEYRQRAGRSKVTGHRARHDAGDVGHGTPAARPVHARRWAVHLTVIAKGPEPGRVKVTTTPRAPAPWCPSKPSGPGSLERFRGRGATGSPRRVPETCRCR
ncbi:MAG: glycosyltransferase [Ilumatobacteraceae bacterium]